jgi:hypothetical protein
MATISEKQLGQVRNTLGGTAESLYSPAASTTAIIKSIVVCENSGNADSFDIYLDDERCDCSQRDDHPERLLAHEQRIRQPRC